MSDLEGFRKETRAWLEANCPASMRWPGDSGNPVLGDELVWGGRKWKGADSDARAWLALETPPPADTVQSREAILADLGRFAQNNRLMLALLEAMSA